MCRPGPGARHPADDVLRDLARRQCRAAGAHHGDNHLRRPRAVRPRLGAGSRPRPGARRLRRPRQRRPWRRLRGPGARHARRRPCGGTQADGVFNEAQFALGNNPDDLTPDFAWELRIPFTSLRYPARYHQTWGVIVHRVYPRELTHSLFSVRMPRGTSCFLCHAQRVELTGLPTGGTLVAAPDATLRPDFSQIEADVPQFSVNSQFALFYPE